MNFPVNLLTVVLGGFLLIGCNPVLDNLPIPEDGLGDWSGFQCADYLLMLDVESRLAGSCVSDSDCGQIMAGTGCGCTKDNLVATHNFDLNYFYDLLGEARAMECTLDFGTPCDCDTTAVPVCRAGQCAWE